MGLTVLRNYALSYVSKNSHPALYFYFLDISYNTPLPPHPNQLQTCHHHRRLPSHPHRYNSSTNLHLHIPTRLPSLPNEICSWMPHTEHPNSRHHRQALKRIKHPLVRERIPMDTHRELDQPVHRPHLNPSSAFLHSPLRHTPKLNGIQLTTINPLEIYTALNTFRHPSSTSGLTSPRRVKTSNLPTTPKKNTTVASCTPSPTIKTSTPIFVVLPSQFPELAIPLPDTCIRNVMTSEMTKIFVSLRKGM